MWRRLKNVFFGINERKTQEELEDALFTSMIYLKRLEQSIEEYIKLIKSVEMALEGIREKRQSMQEAMEALLMETHDSACSRKHVWDKNNDSNSNNLFDSNREDNGLEEEQNRQYVRRQILEEYESIRNKCDDEMSVTSGRLFELRIALETLKIHKSNLECTIAQSEEQHGMYTVNPTLHV